MKNETTKSVELVPRLTEVNSEILKHQQETIKFNIEYLTFSEMAHCFDQSIWPYTRPKPSSEELAAKIADFEKRKKILSKRESDLLAELNALWSTIMGF